MYLHTQPLFHHATAPELLVENHTPNPDNCQQPKLRQEGRHRGVGRTQSASTALEVSHGKEMPAKLKSEASLARRQDQKSLPRASAEEVVRKVVSPSVHLSHCL